MTWTGSFAREAVNFLQIPADSPSLCTARGSELCTVTALTAKLVNTTENSMFSKNRKKKTEDQSRPAHAFNTMIHPEDRLGIGIRAEPEASALIFMVHNRGEEILCHKCASSPFSVSMEIPTGGSRRSCFSPIK